MPVLSNNPQSASAEEFTIRQTANQKNEFLVVSVLALAFGVYRAVRLGQDTNWDWQNYHDYDVLALFHGRGAVDVAPAGIQTFLNPLPYIPFYLLRHFLPPMLGGAIVGAVQALNLPVAWILLRRLLPDFGWFAMAAAMVISSSGAMTLSEIGTSFADLPTALAVLAGIVLLLPAGPRRPRTVLIAGIFVGAAVGLKLTNAAFAVGALVMILCGERPLRLAAWFGLGGAFGAVLTGGAWSIYLWQEFQNPFFPFYNAIFHSAAGPAWNAPRVVPYRFPHGFIDALSYPFRWVVAGNSTAEATFRDARFAVLGVLAAIGLCAAAWRRRWALSHRETEFCIFFAVSFLLWMLAFSIQRYLIVLEILCGPLIVVLFHRAAPVVARNIMIGATALALVLWVKPSDWGHRPWIKAFDRILLAETLQNPATYFLVDKPVAYAVRSFPAESRFYQLADSDLPILAGALFDQRIRGALARPLPGGTWVMRIKGYPTPTDLLGQYHLEIDDARSCLTLAGAGPDLEFCPLRQDQSR
jgi:Glycosyltransferase family 87